MRTSVRWSISCGGISNVIDILGSNNGNDPITIQQSDSEIFYNPGDWVITLNMQAWYDSENSGETYVIVAADPSAGLGYMSQQCTINQSPGPGYCNPVLDSSYPLVLWNMVRATISGNLSVWAIFSSGNNPNELLRSQRIIMNQAVNLKSGDSVEINMNLSELNLTPGNIYFHGLAFRLTGLNRTGTRTFRPYNTEKLVYFNGTSRDEASFPISSSQTNEETKPASYWAPSDNFMKVSGSFDYINISGGSGELEYSIRSSSRDTRFAVY